VQTFVDGGSTKVLQQLPWGGTKREAQSSPEIVLAFRCFVLFMKGRNPKDGTQGCYSTLSQLLLVVPYPALLGISLLSSRGAKTASSPKPTNTRFNQRRASPRFPHQAPTQSSRLLLKIEEECTFGTSSLGYIVTRYSTQLVGMYMD